MGKPRPFRCYLDVGLAPTTTGSRVFGVMKGAVDGGLAIPHNHKRFPGYDAEAKEMDAEVFRDYIFGEHVANYMRELQDEDDEAFRKQFAKYIKLGVGADDIEDMITEAHEKIRENPHPQEEPGGQGTQVVQEDSPLVRSAQGSHQAEEGVLPQEGLLRPRPKLLEL